MTPANFRDRLYVSIKRGPQTEIRVGIRLEAVLQVDSNKDEDIKAYTEQAKDDVVNGVYGGRREELRELLNDILAIGSEMYASNPKAWDKLIRFQESL